MGVVSARRFHIGTLGFVSKHQEIGASPMGKGAQIAIVDDDPGMRDAIAGLLLSLGHRPSCFASADEFLAAPDHRCIDCVILDIRMPGMSGLDLQEALKREAQPPPIIFLSSCADGSVRRRAASQGAHCVLAKPVDDVSLIACIDAALATQS